MNKKKMVAYCAVLFLLAISIVSWSIAAARECKNCGQNCMDGSCDISSSCSQCNIYSCWDAEQGHYWTLPCGTSLPV